MTRKRELSRETILLAAESLLQTPGREDFSMRELSEAAGMSFTTPFKHFGSKDGLLRHLMHRHLGMVEKAFDERAPHGDVIARVLTMAEIGVEYSITYASLSRLATVAIAEQDRGEIDYDVNRLWTRALGDYDGLESEWRDLAARFLPEHLTVFYRGALVMWTTNDFSNEQFSAVVETGVAVALAAFCNAERKRELAVRIASKRDLLPHV